MKQGSIEPQASARARQLPVPRACRGTSLRTSMRAALVCPGDVALSDAARLRVHGSVAAAAAGATRASVPSRACDIAITVSSAG